jgi:hypothetical protein
MDAIYYSYLLILKALTPSEYRSLSKPAASESALSSVASFCLLPCEVLP